MRIVVFPGVLRPPSDAALLGSVTAARLGAHATAVDLSRRAVLNARLNARMVVVEGRGEIGAPVPEPVR